MILRTPRTTSSLFFVCPTTASTIRKLASTKKYTIEEAKAARSSLHSAIAEGRHIGQLGSSSRVKADAATISDLLEVLPSKGVIQSIRDSDFAGTFDRAVILDPISLFTYERDGPEYEFLDQELESLRQNFRANCVRFKSELAGHSFPLNSPGTFSRVPSEWKMEQPELFTKVIGSIHFKRRCRLRVLRPTHPNWWVLLVVKEISICECRGRRGRSKTSL